MTPSSPSQDAPSVTIANDVLRVLIYLPDQARGFFRGTRFDWAGVIGRLEFANHVYYEPWFSRTDPGTLDWDATPEIVAGPNTAITGPAEEFKRPLGFDRAQAGATFVKVGVGALRKPADGEAYSSMRLYDIVNGGTRTTATTPTSATFTHALDDGSSGYGYDYTKTIRLVAERSEMRLEHQLKNTGREAIDTNVYNHNFLTLDGLPTGRGWVVTTPYDIVSSRPANVELAEIRGRSVIYVADLTGRQTMSADLGGFGATAADYDFRIEHSAAQAGVRVTGDRPLSEVALWSMRTTLSLEPFHSIRLAPGEEFTWSLAYTFYTLDTPSAGPEGRAPHSDDGLT